MSLERTIRMMAEKKVVKEDGHTDVASAKRQCKTAMEDAQAIIGVLDGMNDEDALPTWWTNKLAIAANSMNKLNDYLSNPTEQKEEIEMEGLDNLIEGALNKKAVETGKVKTGASKSRMSAMQKQYDNRPTLRKNEEVKYPHMMYDPETGKGVEAKTPEDHDKLAKKGYTHEKPELDEAIKYQFAAVDKKGLVIGFASKESDAKDMARRNKGRVVTLTKPLSPKKGDMMVNRPLPDNMDKFPPNTSATQGKRMEDTVNEHTYYKMEPFGVSRSLVDSVKAVLAGKPSRENIPEEILDDDVADFIGAASKAAAAGKKKFKFGDKEYPVTIKKSTADKISKKMDEAVKKEEDEEPADDKKAKDKKDEKNGKKEPIEIDPEIKEEAEKCPDCGKVHEGSCGMHEAEMTDAQMARREEIVKELKKKEDEFKERYGDRYKEVMYATATKMAMKDK